MRILQIIFGYYHPQHGQIGGAAKVAYDYCRTLAGQGHDVTVCTSNFYNVDLRVSAQTEELCFDGHRSIYFRTHRVSPAGRGGGVGFHFSPEAARWLNREIGSFDVVHLHGFRHFFSLVAAMLLRSGEIPYIVQPHGEIAMMLRSASAKRAYDVIIGRRILRGGRCVLALTEDERYQCEQASVDPDKIVSIPNGIEVLDTASLASRRGELRRLLGLSDEEMVVLYLGRIHIAKGVDALVQAMVKLPAYVHLVVVGPDDGYLAEVTALVQQHQLEGRVHFVGNIQDVWDAYVGADIFVLPARFDTFPLTVLEAAACHLPMVVTDRCKISEILNANKAALVIGFDEREIADAVVRLLNDLELRQIISGNAYQLVTSRFSLDTVVHKLLELYTAAVDGRCATRCQDA